MTSDRSSDVIVVGAGISGLTAAGRLAAAGLDVRVLEAGDRPGGRIATRALGGGLMELGAQFLSSGYELVPEMIRDAGLDREIVTVSGRSMVIADGRTWRFDTDRPLSFLSGGLLRARDIAPAARGFWSVRGLTRRSRIDLALWSDLDSHQGLEWATRRFGAGLTRRALLPTVNGLFFQDLADSSAVLPGSLAAFSARGPKAFILRRGLGSFTTAVAAQLDVEYGTAVEHVQPPDTPGGRVQITTSRGRRESNAVVIATPAGPAATMLADPTPDESAVLRTSYSSALIIGLALTEPLADNALGGAYGVLFPPDPSSPLAALAVHSRADPAARGEVRTVMIRQGHNTDRLMTADDTAVSAAAVAAATPLLPGLAELVVESHVARWQEALPYLPVGHATAVRHCREGLPARTPVLLAGDFLGLPWSDSAAFNGRWAADHLIAALSS